MERFYRAPNDAFSVKMYKHGVDFNFRDGSYLNLIQFFIDEHIKQTNELYEKVTKSACRNTGRINS